VTAASTVEGHAGLRANGPALGAAARGCDAVLRLLDEAQPNPGAYNLLCRYLALLDAGDGSELSIALAFRLKLALVAGFAPELASCARCGEAEDLVAFSGSAGGVVCGACEQGGFAIGEESHRFMVAALGNPLAEAPGASPQALRQVERAIGETLEHHAHVRLRSAA
jgi:DNA repair protein RecO (recombination protein O)